ncbi:hypothetical protein [Mesorhizobium humile]|uniref:hypothetical protein n=1 Tax=Mesorhizobium humile TaxID=3072313 RepID=UPI003D318DA7
MDGPQPTIDGDLVRRLVDTQFPEWRHLPVSPVAFGGWDNRTFHLGDTNQAEVERQRQVIGEVLADHGRRA